jgi:hypothetical protein
MKKRIAPNKSQAAAPAGTLPSSDRKAPRDREYYGALTAHLQNHAEDPLRRFLDFSKYVPRQNLSAFLTKYEMFKQVLEVPGSIVECGVFHGQGLMSFAQFSAIMEPTHYVRKVIGFDTFAGFPDVSDEDTRTSDLAYSGQHQAGGYRADAYDDLTAAIRLYDMNRSLGHIPKVELVKGDVRKTVPKYVEDNPHLVVALLYLDLDLHEPTRVALECLLERIPRGGIIAFDELNDKAWPGETTAVLQSVGIRNLRLRRSAFDSKICYAVIE